MKKKKKCRELQVAGVTKVLIKNLPLESTSTREVLCSLTNSLASCPSTTSLIQFLSQNNKQQHPVCFANFVKHF